MGAENSLLVNAYRGKKGARPPVWFMRQAGRFLPEYREIRARHSMLEVIMTPELAAEVTMQPMRRFDLDGAIIFADILNPLIGMGMELEFKEGEGPTLRNPLKDPSDVQRLRIPDAVENVSYTLDAIQIVVGKLGPAGKPLIGFSGAPLTLSSYMIEGRSPGDLHKVKEFMCEAPDAWHTLQEKLVTLVSEYLIVQAKAGVSALQIFDSWVGFLGPREFTTFVAPYLKRIIAKVKAETTLPVIYFATGTAGLMSHYNELGMDVVGVDWRMSLTDADKILGHRYPLQGNLDPALLAAPLSYLEESVKQIIAEGRTLPAHIFNLGHGIVPSTPIRSVEKVISLVKESA